MQRVRAGFDGYSTAIWVAPADGGSPARPLTIGARRDSQARWSPDGRSIAFLSDRRTLVEEEPAAPKDREDGAQLYLLPMDRPGEARRLTDLPRGVERFSWSPDGRHLAVLSSSRASTRDTDARARRKLPDPPPGEPPASDYRYTDRLRYQENGAGFVATRRAQVWIVDAGTGGARRLTDLSAGVEDAVWSPEGGRVAVTSVGRGLEPGLRSRVLVVDVASGRITPIAAHPDGYYVAPAWLPDGGTVALLGGILPDALYRAEVRLFPADGSEARGHGRDLTGPHDVMPGSSMASDITIVEPARLLPTPDGQGILFLAPHRGAFEAWRVAVADGRLERLTEGRHQLSALHAVGLADGGLRIATIRSTPTELPDVDVGDVPSSTSSSPSGGVESGSVKLRPVSDANGDLRAEVELQAPTERWTTIDGHPVQGWLISAAGDADRPSPAVLEIHGGPHSLYGWSPLWEFQVLAASGISVLCANPRGSEGYGRAFNEGNRGDWGDGPMRDVLGILDGVVADGLVDSERLGVTGGSYGGYLTSWIVGHDQRFRAAITCRSVNDLTTLFLTGDIGGTDWARYEMGAFSWEDPERFRRLSPLTYADAIRTPLLIQHSERDIRTTIGQAEALFAALRRRRRPVRLMRVPEENHELTRSGTPFRRVENLVQVRDWFRHFLVNGRRGLPPIPRTKHGD